MPLVCLGVPVGVLCLTEGEDEDSLSLEETNVLRLLGMQISEFLAADPEVERLLQQTNVAGLDGLAEVDLIEAVDGDAELARSVCEAVAAEVEPDRVLRLALRAIADRLGAAPASLFLQSTGPAASDSEGERLILEAEHDGGVVGERNELPIDRGLLGTVWQTGRLVAVDRPESDARFDAEVDTAADGITRPMICVPIQLRDKNVGILRVFLPEGTPASPRTAEILAAAFSAAVRNVLLYRSLVQSIEEVAEVRRQARGSADVQPDRIGNQ